jgi:formylglycine-generating enzyme required for sulfatase activity
MLLITSCSDRSSLFDNSDADESVLGVFIEYTLDRERVGREFTHRYDTIAPGTSLKLEAQITVDGEVDESGDRWIDFLTMQWITPEDTISGLSASIKPTLRGKYPIIFRTKDLSGAWIADTLDLIINTPIQIHSERTPMQGSTQVPPDTVSGILFEWQLSGLEPSETFTSSFYLGTDSSNLFDEGFVSSLNNQSQIKWPLNLVKYFGSDYTTDSSYTFFWGIVALDQFGATDTSEIYRFRTLTGQPGVAGLMGTIIPADLQTVESIRIEIRGSNGVYAEAFPDAMGNYFISGLGEGNWSIFARDTSLTGFQTDSVSIFLSDREIREVNFEFEDRTPPILQMRFPLPIFKDLRPTIAIQVFEKGSGLNPLSLNFKLNGVNQSATLQNDFIFYTPDFNLLNGDQVIEVWVADRAENHSGGQYFSFRVERMNIHPARVYLGIPGAQTDIFYQIDLPDPFLQVDWDTNGDGLIDTTTSNGVLALTYTNPGPVTVYSYFRTGNNLFLKDTLEFTIETPPQPILWRTNAGSILYSGDSLKWQLSQPLEAPFQLSLSLVHGFSVLVETAEGTSWVIPPNFDPGNYSANITLHNSETGFAVNSSPLNFSVGNGYIQNMNLISSGVFVDDFESDCNDPHTSCDSVYITQAYRLSQYEVKQKDFEDRMGYNPSLIKGSQLPVHNLSFYESIRYANALSRYHGLDTVYNYSICRYCTPEHTGDTLANLTANLLRNGFRLPSEDQWELAARGNSQSIWPAQQNVKDCRFHNFAECNLGLLRPGSLASDARGLYDMGGNVSEYVWGFSQNDAGRIGDRSNWIQGLTFNGVILKGGDFFNNPNPIAKNYYRMHSATRLTTRNPYAGLRLALPEN